MILEIDTEKKIATVTSFKEYEVFDIDEIASILNDVAFSLSRHKILMTTEALESIKNGSGHEGEQ